MYDLFRIMSCFTLMDYFKVDDLNILNMLKMYFTLSFFLMNSKIVSFSVILDHYEVIKGLFLNYLFEINLSVNYYLAELSLSNF